jgi:hypothetical protein
MRRGGRGREKGGSGVVLEEKEEERMERHV